MWLLLKIKSVMLVVPPVFKEIVIRLIMAILGLAFFATCCALGGIQNRTTNISNEENAIGAPSKLWGVELWTAQELQKAGGFLPLPYWC